MSTTPRQFMNSQRLAVLAESIIWGNAYFQPKPGLAVAASGKAYTVSNLHYAAALLEAVFEGHEIELDEKTASARANAILEKILRPIAGEPKRKPGPDQKRGVFVPRIVGSRTARLSAQRIANDIASVLVFLNLHSSQLGLTRSAAAQVRRALQAIVETQVEGQKQPSKSRRSRKRVAEQNPEAILVELGKFEASLPPQYHWSQSIQKIPNLEISDPPYKWPKFPKISCAYPLEPCMEHGCLVAARDSTELTIPARFYKGDWKPANGQMLPVIFVGGWEPRLSASGGGFGFASSSRRLMRPPAYSPSPGEGKHDYPPPLIELLPEVSPHKEFAGLATKLRQAGYDHVRFSQSHPGDEIKTSVAELYGVIDKTKALYKVDKVILVCHSRGGLIARRCIADRWTSLHTVDVEKLITYGSPHMGAQLADIGEDIIINLSALLMPMIGPNIESILDLIGIIPGVGATIKEEIESQIVSFAAELLPPALDGVRAFLESGEEMKTTSGFIQKLNEDYSHPDIPLGGRQVSLWSAIDHVLIAGTSPTQLKLYLGSWLPHFDPLTVAEELTPRVETKKHKVWDGVYSYSVHLYWLWEWTWHQVLDFFSDFSIRIDALAADLTGDPTVVLAYHPGLGDGVVEKTSAHAEGVAGKIRRSEFPLEHFFELVLNDEVYTLHKAPNGEYVKVNPWQLMFVELGLPFDQVSGCSPIGESDQ